MVRIQWKTIYSYDTTGKEKKENRSCWNIFCCADKHCLFYIFSKWEGRKGDPKIKILNHHLKKNSSREGIQSNFQIKKKQKNNILPTKLLILAKDCLTYECEIIFPPTTTTTGIFSFFFCFILHLPAINFPSLTPYSFFLPR